MMLIRSFVFHFVVDCDYNFTYLNINDKQFWHEFSE